MKSKSAECLERFLNELAQDPGIGHYVRMVSGQISSVVQMLGADVLWSKILKVAPRVAAIDEEVERERHDAARL